MTLGLCSMEREERKQKGNRKGKARRTPQFLVNKSSLPSDRKSHRNTRPKISIKMEIKKGKTDEGEHNSTESFQKTGRV